MPSTGNYAKLFLHIMKTDIQKFMRVITYRSIVKDGKSIFHQPGDIRFGKVTFGIMVAVALHRDFTT